MYKNGDELSDRKKIILKAIIDAHIDNGEPVGSKYLTYNKQIALSSATIRNEMAELEEMGYLEQPHTSAGRIPSEQGYRFFVNSLMQSYRLTANELLKLNSLFTNKIEELDKILDSSSKLMSMLTNYASLAVKPKSKQITVVRFKTILLDGENFLLIMITNMNVVKTRYIRVTLLLSEGKLQHFENMLNVYLTNITMDMVTLPLMMEIENRLPDCRDLVSPVIKCIYEVLDELDDGDLKFDGVNKLLQYPEFTDIERVRELLDILENKDEILEIISNSAHDIINIYIGSENTVDIMQKSTLIFKTIKSGERIVGAIGVLGPCRMDYSKVVTTIEYLANSITEKTNNIQSNKMLSGGENKNNE